VTERVYLVPGFFGFANLGELTYFGHVRRLLLAAGARAGRTLAVHAVRAPPTGSLPARAARLAETIAATSGPRDGPVHLVGHSSGGLDVRLMLSPGVSLPTSVDVERVAARVTTAVTVATPHAGTPLAWFFTGVVGRQVLEILSLSTIYVLRFGRLPLTALLRLGAAFARVDRHLGVNSAILDQLFGQLLGDFSVGRRHAILRLFEQVHHDQALVAQLAPEAMEVFNAATRPRPDVRCGCVVTRARPPGFGSAMAAGLDPGAHATHAIYGALHRLASATRTTRRLAPAQTRALVRAYGTRPGVAANDGVVPTLSQVWGDVVAAVRADHLDVIGHFGDANHVPPHFDWLSTGTGFDREAFEAVWIAVGRFQARGRTTRG
jgi:triacylglycerol lipase